MKPLFRRLALGLVIGPAVATAGFAAEVDARIQNGVLSFVGGERFSNSVLLITGPGDYEREETASRGTPVFRAVNSGRLQDGLYQYSLSAATDEKVKLSAKDNLDSGRGDLQRDYVLKSFHFSGAFVVSKGTIKEADASGGGADGDAE